ncbi:hypothetical protein GC163_04380 [bacterium]|nr:hypothetical protein [bacterium]
MKATLRLLVAWATCSVAASVFAQEQATGPISADDAIVQAYLARWSDAIHDATRLSAEFHIQQCNGLLQSVSYGRGSCYRDGSNWAYQLIPYEKFPASAADLRSVRSPQAPIRATSQTSRQRVDRLLWTTIPSASVSQMPAYSVIDNPTEIFVGRGDRNDDPIYEVIEWKPASAKNPVNTTWQNWNAEFFGKNYAPQAVMPLFLPINQPLADYTFKLRLCDSDYVIIDLLSRQDPAMMHAPRRTLRVAFRPTEQLPCIVLTHDGVSWVQRFSFHNVRVNAEAEIPQGTFDRPARVHDALEHLKSLQTK